MPGNVNTISEPALNAPPDIVTVSTPPATPAVALGEPVPGDVNATVFADKLCGALPPRVMRRVLPVGTTAAGVNDTVMVTEPVFFATLLSVMVGALEPRDPLTMATQVPPLFDSRTVPALCVIAVFKLFAALVAALGLVTVAGSRSRIVSPPARVPVVNVIPSTDEDIAALAAGEPATGVTTATVFADRTKLRLPVSVIKILPLFGIAFRGETVSVNVTEDVA